MVTIAVPMGPPVRLERAIVTTMTIVKVISNVGKITATGQSTPALTPLTIAAKERGMSTPPTSPWHRSSPALAGTLAVLRMRFVVWERATVTQIPTAAKV